MKKLLLALVFSLLLFSSIAAARSSIYAPAVDSQGNGVLTTLIAEATPGSGRIRTDIRTSLVSTDTEESIRNAAQAAAKEAGVDLRSYDVNIDIDSQAEIIDGPSGGLALSLIIYNELNNLKTSTSNRLRGDLTVTGAIDKDGSVIRVGGLEEKVTAAHQRGLTLMLIASGQSSADSVDYVVYGREISSGKLQVVEVPTLHAALQYVYTADRSKIADAPEFAIKPVVLIPFSATQRTQHVKVIAQEEIENAKRELQALVARENRGEDGEIAAVIRSVNSSLRNAQNALDNGYYYTAANSAFLARITIETATSQTLNADEFAAMVNSLEAQQQEYAAGKPRFTNVNFEPLAVADLRYWWSITKLGEVKEAFQKNNAVTQGEARDYYTSRAWLQAAEKLANNAKTLTVGEEANESNAREYALDLIEAAIPIANSSTDSEVLWHYKTSRREITEGAYVDAAFDLQYIFSIDSTAKLLENKTIAQAMAMLGRTNTANLYAAGNSALWAELFYAHSVDSQQENEAAPDPSTIISTFRLREMARDFNATKTTLAQEFISPRPAKNHSSEIPTISSPTSNQPGQPFPQASRSPQQPRVTATITPQLDAKQVIAALLIGIGVVVLIAVALNKLGSQTSPRQMLEKLDSALVSGRISEATYRRLRAKYKKQLMEMAKSSKARLKKRHWPAT